MAAGVARKNVGYFPGIHPLGELAYGFQVAVAAAGKLHVFNGAVLLHFKGNLRRAHAF